MFDKDGTGRINVSSFKKVLPSRKLKTHIEDSGYASMKSTVNLKPEVNIDNLMRTNVTTISRNQSISGVKDQIQDKVEDKKWTDLLKSVDTENQGYITRE